MTAEDGGPVIDGDYTVASETRSPLPPRREPIFGPWKAILAFAIFIGLRAIFIIYGKQHH